MKYLALALALLLAAPLAHAQKGKDNTAPTLPIDPETHKVDYTGVVEVAGVTQAQLYTRAYEWVAKNYNSALDVLQMQDKDAGTLIVKGNTKAYFHGHPFGLVAHTLSIYVKEGKYKYGITDLQHVAEANSYGSFEQDEPHYAPGASKGTAQKAWNEIKRTTDADVRAIIASLQTAMAAKAKRDF
jgi:NADH dehydrogenase/NADH:ubiquinone oxidoreductase subunit G